MLRKFSEVSVKGLVQALLMASVAVLASAQDRAQTTPLQFPPGMKGQYEIEKATVEEVFKVTSDGFRFIAYVVTWHGERVVVSDPLARTEHAVGDEISFMASRSEMSSASSGNVKLLSFMIMELNMPRPASAK
jgi:hypothetical protein